ncbi:PTS transporter subunit EIIC [Bacillaceae bacterium Marseille-Q3522]|nr:PTS transporter subunit EIIC [Bacillaceae bacterium Marseille-Q3522]
MKKDPRTTAGQLLKAFGEKENILSVTHCSTRLRLEVKNASLVSEADILAADGVAGYFLKSGQHQVILGTGYVNKVCTEFQRLSGVGEVAEESSVRSNENASTFQKLTKMISDIFIPIIPVLLATGVLMGLRGLLVNGIHMEIPANIDSVFSVLTDTAYTFIPVLVCWSAVKKFGGSPILGIVLGLMLVSPILPNKWEVVNGAAEPLKFALGSFNFDITGYQSSVLPALFLGAFAAKLETKLHKVIPDIVDMLLVPFLTLLTSLIFGLFIVGPVLSMVEKGVTDLVLKALEMPFGIGGIIYGGGIQLLCAVGMHHTVTPIIVSLYTQTGVDFINPLGTAAIAGQLGAGLALVMMQRNKTQRAKMVPALIPALFGISEPVMYGLNFPKLKPFFMGCVGGAAGGAFSGIIQLAAKGTGASMFPGALLYLDGGLISYLIVMTISIVTAYVSTYFVMRKDHEA